MDERLAKRRTAVILLVEDDPGDQELTRRALKEGILITDLHVVSDGQEALDYLQRRAEYANPSASPRPDLILLDLNMPRMDGREVLRHVRKDPDIAHIPIVVLTTSEQEQDILQSYKIGCNSFITKPVYFDNFIRAVQQLDRYWLELVTLPPRLE